MQSQVALKCRDISVVRTLVSYMHAPTGVVLDDLFIERFNRYAALLPRLCNLPHMQAHVLLNLVSSRRCMPMCWCC